MEERRQQDNIRINRRIRVPEVRVINAEGEQLGIMPTHEALRIATEEGFDLVEVSPRALPPVCRIMDYGKYKYLQAKKEAESRKTSKSLEMKEIKVHPKTGENDLQYRLQHAIEFLKEGHSVKVTCIFKGREIIHKAIGEAHLNFFIKGVEGVGVATQAPRLEGKTMSILLMKGK